VYLHDTPARELLHKRSARILVLLYSGSFCATAISRKNSTSGNRMEFIERIKLQLSSVKTKNSPFKTGRSLYI